MTNLLKTRLEAREYPARLVKKDDHHSPLWSKALYAQCLKIASSKVLTPSFRMHPSSTIQAPKTYCVEKLPQSTEHSTSPTIHIN